MRIYNITDEPIRICGLAVVDAAQRRFWKLPEYMLDAIPKYDYLGKRAVGGRVRFCTNSRSLFVRMTLAQTKEDINIPLSGSAGADIYVGSGEQSRFVGYIAPGEHVMEEITVEKTFKLSGQMELVTINLPRNDHLLAMEIGVEEEAQVEAAPAYTVSKPIVFYGSSITEGGCASRAGNAYTSIVSRWLDADYYNYGFSGSARGEEVFAEYIASLKDISAFVYDYDHNAQSAEALADTHERFFKIVRAAHPQIPVLMMSKPDVDKAGVQAEERRDVIEQTYLNAKNAGDDKVWFLDGGKFFGTMGRAECTVDGTHPNALGFMRMAENVYPVLKEMLKL